MARGTNTGSSRRADSATIRAIITTTESRLLGSVVLCAETTQVTHWRKRRCNGCHHDDHQRPSYAQLKESMLDSTSRLFATNPIDSGQDNTDDPGDPRRQRVSTRWWRPPNATLRPSRRSTSSYFARVYRYLRIRLQSEEDAADLTQQVFLKALDALPRYRTHGAPFAAWLFTIARHTLADRFRRHPVTLPLEAASQDYWPSMRWRPSCCSMNPSSNSLCCWAV